MSLDNWNSLTPEKGITLQKNSKELDNMEYGIHFGARSPEWKTIIFKYCECLNDFKLDSSKTLHRSPFESALSVNVNRLTPGDHGHSFSCCDSYASGTYLQGNLQTEIFK